mmetsp:Transcript_52519/g.115197  ORF Transcript_52519/g.115197 Transcript_52519/m.115197 type:complete len:288 (+) Transcript_52519:48-911(+)
MSVLTASWSRLAVEEVAPFVVECRMNRPEKRNAMDLPMFDELREFFGMVSADPRVRVVVLTGAGPAFSGGIDFSSFQAIGTAGSDVGLKAMKIREVGKEWQTTFTNMERCGKAVIACVHGACVGIGIELVSAVDIRICSSDSFFALKEIDLGIPADVGGLQRFPKVMANQSLVRELAFSARDFPAAEALASGFVSRVVDGGQAAVHAAAVALATTIAEKSPIALLGTKTLLNYTRDHSVDESLEYALTWNQGMLQAAGSQQPMVAYMSKKKAEYEPFPGLAPTKSKL